MNTTERIPIYKVELEYYANKNYLMFIPSIYVSIWWTSLYIKIKWLFFELTLMFVFDASRQMGGGRDMRLHHSIYWPHAVPCIISEKYKKK